MARICNKEINARPIRVTESVYQKLLNERDYFQETINGGRWSISDTINEMFKITDICSEKPNNKRRK
jgi:hypothetical protein